MYALFHKIQKASKLHHSFAIGSPALIWQFIFFYLPLVLMLAGSLLKWSDAGTFQGVTIENFRPLFSKTYLNIILYSTVLAASTAILCAVIAFPLAHFISFRTRKYKTVVLFFLIVPFWTNLLLHVYSWFFVLERTGLVNNLLIFLNLIKSPIPFLNSNFSVILMMVYYFLPFMVLPIFSALEKLDRRLIEVSSDLGASFKQTLLKVVLPLTFTHIRAGFFLVFIPAFGEFIIPELMGGDKQYFVGSVVSLYILGKDTEKLGAAFMLLACISLALAASLIYFIFKRISKRLIGKSR